MNRAQLAAADTAPLAPRCELARLLASVPTEIIAAHSRYTNHRKLAPAERNEDRNAAKPGGRKRTKKVLAREAKVREAVIKFLRFNAPTKYTFAELCQHLGIRNWKMNRNFVFALGEAGIISTDLQPWGRRLWLERGK